MKVKDEITKLEIASYLKELQVKQTELSDTEDIYYSRISLYMALKKNILFKNILLHPIATTITPFYNERIQIEENELEQLLASILEFEFTNDVEYLNTQERKIIIKLHKSLKRKRENESD